MVQLVILLLLASFVLVFCKEDAPSNHQEFRQVLNRAVYLDGSGRQVNKLTGFAQWNFKSMFFRDEVFMIFSAGEGLSVSVLREAKNYRNHSSGGPRARMLKRDSAIYDVMVLRIPKQQDYIGHFLFAYLDEPRTNDATLPFRPFFALQWRYNYAGKQDWVFASFWKGKGNPNNLEWVPLGPRPESATKYSIQVADDKIRIFVNSSLVLVKQMPGVGSIPFVRTARVALTKNPNPANSHRAVVFLKSIAWGVHGEP